jgi:hypothetical protein
VAVAPALLLRRAPHVRAEDRNGDGRPDIWSTYDRQSQLAAVAIDSNFDGRLDVQEYYEGGVLLRRESDRDFNDRVDLVQEFDSRTHERVRSVEDVDFDGSADLLVLFRDGRPVYRKWARVDPSVRVRSTGRDTPVRTAEQQLAPFDDPFRSDLAVSAVHRPTDFGNGIGLSTSGGLPASARRISGPVVSSSSITGRTAPHFASERTARYSPRSPPSSSLLG